jgi:hypothetical protein
MFFRTFCARFPEGLHHQPHHGLFSTSHSCRNQTGTQTSKTSNITSTIAEMFCVAREPLGSPSITISLRRPHQAALENLNVSIAS